MIMLLKGSKLVCKNNGYTYVKLEDEDFAWWALQDEKLPVERQMQVRLTDEMAIKGYLAYELIKE